MSLKQNCGTHIDFLQLNNELKRVLEHTTPVIWKPWWANLSSKLLHC